MCLNAETVLYSIDIYEIETNTLLAQKCSYTLQLIIMLLLLMRITIKNFIEVSIKIAVTTTNRVHLAKC